VLPGSLSGSFFFVGCLVVLGVSSVEEVGGLEDCLREMVWLVLGSCER
jgi:hypothetical protein